MTQLFLQEALKRGPERVAAVTFTRSAADELRTRTAAALGITTTNPKLLRARLPYVGTIHSLCYALLGRPQLVDSGGHFAQFCVQHGLTAAGPLDAPRDMEEASPYIALEAAGKSDVAQMRTFVAAAAHRCVPISAVLRDTPGLDAGRISRLAQEYEAWKTKEALLDYEDLLYQAAGRRLRGVQVLICDEVQDCQPTGTMVTVATGRGPARRLSKVPIETVRVGDNVASYHRHGMTLGGGVVDGVTVRPYQGRVICVGAGSRTSRYTPEHHCIVKVGGAFKDKHIVYLMRKGSSYRVGVSSAYRDGVSASTGLKSRMLTEGADAAWVLQVFDDRRDAYVEEEMVTVRHGLPQVCFSPRNSREGHITRFWEVLGSNEENARRCLAAYGRDIRYPLMDRAGYFLYGRASVVRACNLTDGMTMLDGDEALSRVGQKVHRIDEAWKPITVHEEMYDGLIYSLSVATYHTYVADGLVTHNCSKAMWRCLDGWASGTELAVFAGDPFQSLYAFVGASPDLFLGRTGRRYVLGRSYRLSAGSVAYANDLLRGAGHVPEIWVGGGTDLHTTTHLLLGRTNYVLAAARRDLEDRGIPYRELRGRGPLATYAADAYRTCVSIGGDRMVPWEAVAATVSSLPAHVRKGLDQRRIEALGRSGEDCDATAFRSLVGDPATLKRLLPHADYFQRIERRDPSELFTEPKLAVGTVHSAKGREADSVTLLTSWGTLPAQALNEPEGRKSEACVAFVAATRHRHSLELVDVIEGTRYPFPPIPKGD